jgi:hypothetical protein
MADDSQTQASYTPDDEYFSYLKKLLAGTPPPEAKTMVSLGQYSDPAFDKRMFDPATDLDQFGDVKQDVPKSHPFIGKSIESLLKSLKLIQDGLANEPTTDSWQPGIVKDGKTIEARIKRRF